MTVKRSLDSENADVLRVRCAAGDDIGISSITLICAEIVMPYAQTRQDVARAHFYAGESGRAVPVRRNVRTAMRAVCRHPRMRGGRVGANGFAARRMRGEVVACATDIA
ncbi:hypothetical protein [Burkholderia metallica]|uniref:Uncharacterized protein n=1 Tax=Burkholderia metallica TaxID=488729 RepID=A0ABT8PJ79_9BURK|nr:hypothetical protein [Burkholderia metallica]MCA8000457.1 hypothetical protein [Burkholderia metallica]MCA8020875.1 hypothetical protein [Burkholderia metallica]MDN7935201.1 hypothetical protein [Burkholderia metallica]